LLPNAPRDSGAIWATYQAPSGRFQNLGLSAGLIATSAREDNFFNTALLPGYARLDLGTYYVFRAGEHQRVRLSVNVQNALDRKYYLASNGLDQIRPGSPISALAGLSWSWH
jgi:iron complex outermembrane receptor protein